ncbi:MAG: thiamine phosphate synthase [Thiotrichales bacterium]|nr:thiamine phosphate synthase [Thiotrichales bacterium]
MQNFNSGQQILPAEGIYAITDTDNLDPVQVLEKTEQLLDAGVRLFQYRNKHADQEQLLDLGNSISKLCRQYKALLIVNDSPQLAVEIEAGGVHLGKDDAPLAETRRNYPGLLIGVSCYNDLNCAVDAGQQGADYVAFGSFFTSPTKPGATTAQIDTLKRAKPVLKIPIVAIGGITPENGNRLVTAGADFLAAISGLYGQIDTRKQVKKYLQLFNRE